MDGNLYSIIRARNVKTKNGGSLWQVPDQIPVAVNSSQVILFLKYWIEPSREPHQSYLIRTSNWAAHQSLINLTRPFKAYIAADESSMPEAHTAYLHAYVLLLIWFKFECSKAKHPARWRRHAVDAWYMSVYPKLYTSGLSPSPD